MRIAVAKLARFASKYKRRRTGLGPERGGRHGAEYAGVSRSGMELKVIYLTETAQPVTLTREKLLL